MKSHGLLNRQTTSDNNNYQQDIASNVAIGRHLSYVPSQERDVVENEEAWQDVKSSYCLLTGI
jgi:hypothetical protein